MIHLIMTAVARIAQWHPAGCLRVSPAFLFRPSFVPQNGRGSESVRAGIDCNHRRFRRCRPWRDKSDTGCGTSPGSDSASRHWRRPEALLASIGFVDGGERRGAGNVRRGTDNARERDHLVDHLFGAGSLLGWSRWADGARRNPSGVAA